MITFQPHTKWVTALAFTPDGTALASVSHDHWVKVWDVTGLAGRTLRWEVEDKYCLNHCQFSPDGTELFTGGLDGCIRVWSTTDGKLLREYLTHPSYLHFTSVYAFVLSRDGTRIAWCGRTASAPPSQIVVADTKTLTVTHRIPAHENDGRVLVAHPTGFCSGSADLTVKFWDWNTAACHHTIRLRGMARALAASPDGTRLAVVGVSTIASRLISNPSGKAVHFRGHRTRIECVDFSPDGTRLASASSDGTIRLWDTVTGKCLRVLALKLGPLHWVCFAPDGLTLAFSSLKGDIGLLDLDD